jgi:hypothetical protein
MQVYDGADGQSDCLREFDLVSACQDNPRLMPGGPRGGRDRHDEGSIANTGVESCVCDRDDMICQQP